MQNELVREQSAEYFIDLEERYGAHNYHPLDVVIREAEGVWVTDVEGKRYLDCLSAYSAVNQGHAHPKIRKALIEQASRVTLTARAFRSVAVALPAVLIEPAACVRPAGHRHRPGPARHSGAHRAPQWR